MRGLFSRKAVCAAALLSAACLLSWAAAGYEPPEPSMHWQGEMVGEPTADSAILQARLTKTGRVRNKDVKGRPGVAAFALSTSEGFEDAFRTEWQRATSEDDYIIKTKVTGLIPGARYFYRLLEKDGAEIKAGPTGTFKTLAGQGSGEVRFVVVTGMNRFAFRALSPMQKRKGFPALDTIVEHKPDFMVATGDNVYYDTPFLGRAKTREGMRAKWHRQFATPRFERFFRKVPVYWEKDDHDYRYNDADPYGDLPPSAELGAEVFLEQAPVADPGEKDPLTFRTHRVNDLVQIWLLEGRDYRDPNIMPPGPEKTMWGEKQKAWLKRTLLESEAVFKIVVSPLPMIGPDDIETGKQGWILSAIFGGAPVGQGDDTRKRDNQINPFGFKHEGEQFFDWVVENGLLEENLYLVCGDRHWQYHSVRPDGAEEFSCGALVDGNARLGRTPGDPMSTDPEGLIKQHYTQDEASGGFLQITVRPGENRGPASAVFEFFDEEGERLYREVKKAR